MTAVEVGADLKAEAPEDSGTNGTATAVIGKTGAGTRATAVTRGVLADGRDVDTRYWKKNQMGLSRCAQRRCAPSGVAHAAA